MTNRDSFQTGNTVASEPDDSWKKVLLVAVLVVVGSIAGICAGIWIFVP